MLLRELWRYFPVSLLFCTLAFILEAELFPWTATWSPLGVHWACVMGQDLASVSGCSLRSLVEAENSISVRIVIALLTLPIPLLMLLYTSPSYLLGVFSGFHLPFLIISPFLQQPLCKVTYTDQQHTLLEQKERNVPISLETNSCAFPWRWIYPMHA